jgi:hypothetical protein
MLLICEIRVAYFKPASACFYRKLNLIRKSNNNEYICILLLKIVSQSVCKFNCNSILFTLFLVDNKGMFP